MRTNYNYNSPLRPAGSGGRFPYWLALAALLLLLLLLLGNALRSALDPSVREQQQWEQEQAHAQAQQLAALDLALAAGWRVLPFVLAGALGAVLVKAAYHRLADRAIVLLDKQARIEQARRLTAPAGVQHLALTYYDSHRNEVIEGQAVEAGALLPAGVPEFGELLRSGRIGAGSRSTSAMASRARLRAIGATYIALASARSRARGKPGARRSCWPNLCWLAPG